METVLSILVGIGLSAACGFRVFVPLLAVGLASASGHLHLAPGFAWMGSTAALVAFGVATLLEIGAYYVPWLDNTLDAAASPAAVVAGTLITASVVTDLDPFLKWSLALIAGGGVAALIQGGTVVTRGFSTATTMGLANPLLATLELGGALLTTLLALLFPVLAILAIAVVTLVVGLRSIRHRAARSAV